MLNFHFYGSLNFFVSYLDGLNKSINLTSVEDIKVILLYSKI